MINNRTSTCSIMLLLQTEAEAVVEVGAIVNFILSHPHPHHHLTPHQRLTLNFHPSPR
jgi:hypothetical protein